MHGTQMQNQRITKYEQVSLDDTPSKIHTFTVIAVRDLYTHDLAY